MSVYQKLTAVTIGAAISSAIIAPSARAWDIPSYDSKLGPNVIYGDERHFIINAAQCHSLLEKLLNTAGSDDRLFSNYRVHTGPIVVDCPQASNGNLEESLLPSGTAAWVTLTALMAALMTVFVLSAAILLATLAAVAIVLFPSRNPILL
jgi:hypothetical protein